MGNSKCGFNQVTGASFSLHPMSDNFVEVIEAALGETNTSKVWMETDDVTTTVRGKTVHVFDVTKSICLHAAKTGQHVAFQATYSVGCPGNAETDTYVEVDDTPCNLTTDETENPFAAAKFSIYPLGGGNYIDTILEQIELMKKHVHVSKAHLSTKLSGGLLDIFTGLEDVFQKTVKAGSHHTVMTVSVSINSPSHK